MTTPDDNLAAALARHEIELPAEQVEKLEAALLLTLGVEIANSVPTRHTDFEKFVARDLADSRVFAAFLGQGEKILDVGTGGGVPGVVLAIIRPDLKVSLCESIAKKARAVADIVDSSAR